MFLSFLSPMHADGWRFVLPGVVLCFLSFRWDFPYVGFVCTVITFWCAYFFRNPSRSVPQNEGLVLSPADGKVSAIAHVSPPAELGLDAKEKWVRVSIFLNIFNVHVNRIPLEGKLKKIVYNKGKFVNASLDKASEHNERNGLVIESHGKLTYACVQIAGLIARRIRCDVTTGTNLISGQYFGLIRFGSRVDVYFPAHYVPQVSIGQTAIAGETVLFNMHAPQTALIGKTI
ncbi:MAG: phosphatidylserine decarboxylase [Alphaproteobacteria bacterium]|nr:MAG: phosphatidylserine decarboxylase [Alphaproteobacteria bacterium]